MEAPDDIPFSLPDETLKVYGRHLNSKFYTYRLLDKLEARINNGKAGLADRIAWFVYNLGAARAASYIRVPPRPVKRNAFGVEEHTIWAFYGFFYTVVLYWMPFNLGEPKLDFAKIFRYGFYRHILRTRCEWIAPGSNLDDTEATGVRLLWTPHLRWELEDFGLSPSAC